MVLEQVNIHTIMTQARNESKFTPIGRKHFDTMAEAFDYCREVDRPVDVFVGGARWKLYPSGKAVEVNIPTIVR